MRYAISGLGMLMCVQAACTRRPVLPNLETELIERERWRQYEQAAALWLDHSKRLAQIGSRLLVNNAALCGSHLRFLGWIAASRADLRLVFPDSDEFSRHLREAMARRYEIGDLSKVIYVLPASPGARSGIRLGDVLLSNLQLPDGQPLDVEIVRDGELHVITVDYVPQCGYSFSVLLSDEIAAFADGTIIQVAIGMLRFAQSDDDLAIVLAHELAHNILAYHLAHRATMQIELEADYVAVYLAARAGFDISGVTNFLRRWAAWSPGEIDRRRSHPGTAERVVRVEATIAEVQEKLRLGEPLLPAGLREVNPQK